MARPWSPHIRGGTRRSWAKVRAAPRVQEPPTCLPNRVRVRRGGSVWFHDIVHTCLGTSFTPRFWEVRRVGGAGGGSGGQGAGQEQGRGGPGIPGVEAVGP